MWEPRKPQPPTTRTEPRDLSGGLSSEAIGRGRDKRRRVNGRWMLLVMVMEGAELSFVPSLTRHGYFWPCRAEIAPEPLFQASNGSNMKFNLCVTKEHRIGPKYRLLVLTILIRTSSYDGSCDLPHVLPGLSADLGRFHFEWSAPHPRYLVVPHFGPDYFQLSRRSPFSRFDLWSLHCSIVVCFLDLLSAALKLRRVTTVALTVLL